MSADQLFPWVVGACLLWAAAWAVFPQFVDYEGDAGDGKGVVSIPKPASHTSYRRRLWLFFGVGAALSVVVDGLQQYQPTKWYLNELTAMANSLTHRPAEVQGFISVLSARVTILWVITFIALAVSLRVSPGRRLVLVAEAVLYLVLTLCIGAWLIAASIKFGLPARPMMIVGTIANLAAGTLVAMRLVLTTFILPRPNQLPILRRARLADTVVIGSFILMGVAVPVAAVSLVASPSMNGSILQRYVPMSALIAFNLVTSVGLLLLRPRRSALPAPLAEPPPIDVITPAYNEAAGIALTLESVDRAAGVYGGKVRVIVSNDGSSDDTKAIAVATMASLRHVEGVFLDHPNTGKAGALNRALAEAKADLVVRLDGDCVLHPDSLRYSAPWFEDPEVGIVGSRMLPREDCTGWYAKMRGIECLVGFGCTRMAEQVVDGVGVVPGTYTAFRRQPMIDLGGFTVGMNGEDTDQTCQFGRLGYRAVLDPRVLCYEDVPATLTDFLEQRTRWARANIHVFARHTPFRNGSAGPRIWFYLLRRAVAYAVVPLSVLAPIYFVLALGNVIAHSSALYVLAVPTVLGLIGSAVVSTAALRYKYTRVIPWIPTYLIFSYIRRVALLESFLSLPTRPAVVRRRGKAPSPATMPAPLGPIVYRVAPRVA